MTAGPAVTYGRHYGTLHRTLTTHLPPAHAEAAIAELAALLTAAAQMHHALGTVQAITVLRQHGADPDAIDLLLAASTGQHESGGDTWSPEEPAEDGRLIETISEVSTRLEEYHDRLVFEYPDVADALQPLIDQLNHVTSQEN